MKILSIRPSPLGTGATIARFDIELTPELRMYDLRLVQTESGRRLTYSQNAAGRRTATFVGTLADEINLPAMHSMGARTPMTALRAIKDDVTSSIADIRFTLLANGYWPIPVNGKRPHIKGWSKLQATNASIASWDRWHLKSFRNYPPIMARRMCRMK